MYARVLLVAAVIPGLLLLLYVYNLDKIEKEPAGLLVKLLFLGALSTVSAFILESIGSLIISPVSSPLVYNLLMYFVVVACAEEGGKIVFLKMGSWKNRAFDYVFDGIVYAVCVGLGFAILENIGYVFQYGLQTALIRAITAIPLHTICAIFMGHYYGLAKRNDVNGKPSGRKKNMRKAFLVPVLIHGFYDYAASDGSTGMLICFLIFVIVLDLVAFARIRAYAKEDRPLVSRPLVPMEDSDGEDSFDA